jgi:hopanoid biosynthesis associated protein HpnK
MRGAGLRSAALSSSGKQTQDESATHALKQLILTADDFGRSPEINAAIERAHRAGFLTQASLMVNEPAADEAVQIARRNPALRVGLHLTLCAGRALSVSPLTDAQGNFSTSPAIAGLRYFFTTALACPLREEIRAQFERFRALGFPPTYWDGHAHLHLHPTILRLAVPIAREHSFRTTRLVREPGPPALLPLIFQALSHTAIPRLQKHGIQFADRVFGLRDTGRMTTTAIARHLENLPDGVSELYFHPGEEPKEPDYATLVPLLAHHQITLSPCPSF